MTQVFLNAHPIEQILAVTSIVCSILWAGLTVLKIIDAVKNTTNGPVRFMLADNRRFGAWFLVLSLVFVFMAIIALRYPPDRRDYGAMAQSWYSIIALDVLCVGMIVEAIYRFRRRRKMPRLIAEYEALLAMDSHPLDALAGGSRRYDPPRQDQQ